MHSPINIVQPLIFKPFKVDLKLRTLIDIQIRKQARNLLKIENSFGSVTYNNIEFSMKSGYFRFPSEHKINGERLPMEFQLIGTSSLGSKIGLSVLFNVGDNVNYFLNELDFGKGYLKELPVSTQANSKFYQVNTHVSFDRLFTNNGSWLMYSGSDTNVPCDEITWLLSYDVVEVHPEQLYDIPTDVSPFFGIKELGSRHIFRNVQNDEAKLDDIKAAEKNANTGLKQQYQADLKKEDQRLMDVLARAVENAQEAENTAIKTAKAKIEEEKKRIQAKMVEDIKETRKKLRAKKEAEAAKQKVADGKYPTTVLYERILDKMVAFNYVPPPCPDFSYYEPPANKTWGYVPANMIMTWEINSFVGLPKVQIANPAPPKPIEPQLVYRPFYFKLKPKCETAPNYSEPLLSMVTTPLPAAPKSVSTIASLAQLDMFILNKTKEQLQETTRLIPVYVKTSPNYTVPTFPTTIFYMLNGTNATNASNTTKGASAANSSVELTPVVIKRTFKQDIIGGQALASKQNQSIVVEPTQNGGYALASKLLVPPPNVLNVSFPIDNQLLRIWPSLKKSFAEGSIPIDAKFPWNPIKESDLMINLEPPKTVDKDYRWILFFWVETPYNVGSDGRQAWIPVYILTHAEFNWKKNEIPPEIPVPKNLTRFKNGSLPVEFLPVRIEPTNASTMMLDPNLLAVPKGINQEDLIAEPTLFRQKLVKKLNVENPLYVQLLESKYQNMVGPLGDLQIRREEEETGIMIDPDIPWRILRKQAELVKIEQDRLKEQALAKPSNTRVIRYKRVCIDYNLEAILNHRSLGEVDGIYPNSYFTCRRWEWVEDTEDQKPSQNSTNVPGGNPFDPRNPSGNSSTTNSSNGTSPGGQTGGQNSSNQAGLEEAAIKEKEVKCRDYLKIILNRRSLFFKEVRNDVLDRECEEIFARMRQERLETFKGGLGPALEIAKDIGEKSGQMLKGAAQDLKNQLKQMNIKLNLNAPKINLGQMRIDGPRAPISAEEAKNLGLVKELARKVN